MPDEQNTEAVLQELINWANRNRIHPKTLPRDLNALRELTELDLSAMYLSDLPESICLLENLQKLYLRCNEISTLPDSIGQLNKLQKLFLDDNQLTELPESMAQLYELQEIWLSGNPWDRESKAYRQQLKQWESHGVEVY